jgi:multidrug efflux system outer membrane protein
MPPPPARPSLPARLLAGLLPLALAACAATAPRATEGEAVPGAFRHADAATPDPTPAAPDGAWWKIFDDPTLDALEERARSGNTTIQAAGARLAKSRAMVRSTDAGRFLQATVRAGASRQGGPLINAAGGEGTLLTPGFDLSYEVDLFGRLRQASEAAALDAGAQEALLRNTMLLVQSSVAEAYLALRGIEAEHAIMEADAQAYRESALITEQRFRAGSVAELEWVRARAELAAIESEQLALVRRRTELEHALAVLTGAAAPGFTLPPQQWVSRIPAVPAGIPASVLARRPDVAAARQAVQAAQARLGLAQTAWLPSLMLNASGGAASPDLGSLVLATARSWNIGAWIGAALLDGGRREAGIHAADADMDAAAAAYRERILDALREVEDQLSAIRLLAAQARSHASALAFGTRSTLLAESRYRSGLASQLDVLDARRTELRTRREALRLQSAQQQATVRLVRALGGGWESGEPR